MADGSNKFGILMTITVAYIVLSFFLVAIGVTLQNSVNYDTSQVDCSIDLGIFEINVNLGICDLQFIQYIDGMPAVINAILLAINILALALVVIILAYG